MSVTFDKGRTELFTVVGAPHLEEQHGDGTGHYRDDDTGRSEAGIAGLWLMFYALIAGVAVAGNSAAIQSAIVTAELLK